MSFSRFCSDILIFNACFAHQAEAAPTERDMILTDIRQSFFPLADFFTAPPAWPWMFSLK